jgi:PAS domain S-box-containing protein
MPASDETGKREDLARELEDARRQMEVLKTESREEISRLKQESAELLEKFRSLVLPWTEAVWEADEEGKGLSYADGWRTFTGQTREEMAETNGWMGAVHPEDREYAGREWHQAVSLAALFEAEFRLRRPDGNYRWTVVRAVPFRNAAGFVKKWIGVNVDIHDRKAAEEALKRNTATLSGINRMFREALRAENAERLGEVCLEVAGEITGSRIGFIGEINQDTGLLEDIAISNPGLEACNIKTTSFYRLPISFEIHGIYGRVILDGKGFFTNDPDSHPDRVGLPSEHIRLDSFLGVPFFRNGRTVGLIAVANRPGGYEDEQLASLEAIAPSMLQALDRQRAEISLRNLTESLEQQVVERTELAETRATQLQSLAVELAEAEERERARIAQLLHDDLQQVLASARLRLRSIRPGGAEGRVVEETGKLLEEAIAKSRHLSHELSPPILEHGSMEDVLHWLSSRMDKQFGLQVELDAEAVEPVSDTVKRLLYRAVQELLFNIVKHAETERAEIILSCGGDFLSIKVRDFGRGFKADSGADAADGRGFGLMTIRERLRNVGGALKIETTPGKGSCFTLEIPRSVADRMSPGGDF